MRECVLLASPCSALMFFFSTIASTSTHQSQTTVAHTHTQSHIIYAQFMHYHPTSHLLPHSYSPYSYSTHKDRLDTLSSTVLGLIPVIKPQHSLLLISPTSLPFFLPSQDLSISLFSNLVPLSLPLSPPPPYS